MSDGVTAVPSPHPVSSSCVDGVAEVLRRFYNCVSSHVNSFRTAVAHSSSPSVGWSHITSRKHVGECDSTCSVGTTVALMGTAHSANCRPTYGASPNLVNVTVVASTPSPTGGSCSVRWSPSNYLSGECSCGNISKDFNCFATTAGVGEVGVRVTNARKINIGHGYATAVADDDFNKSG